MAQKFLTGVQLTDGSAGSPALSFSSDTNTGIYWNTYSGDAKQLNIATDGAVRASFNSAGITSHANVYSSSGGQFRNYAGVWKGTTGQSGGDAQFVLNGKTIMHIDEADERVGIGNTSPYAKLHITGADSTASAIRQSRTGTVIWDQAIDSSGRLQWGTRASEGGTRTVRFGVDDDGTVDFTGNAKWVDDARANFGDNADLQIYHDGTTSNIRNNTGNLSIINHTDDGDIKFFSDDGTGGVTEYFRVDGGTGDTRFSKNTRHLDNVRAEFGSSGNFIIRHDGTNTILQCGSGGGDLTLQVAEDDKDMIFQCDNGSGGVTTYFKLDGSNVNVSIAKDFLFQDNVKARFGNGGDLYIEHDGTNSKIINTNGDLSIQNQADDKDILFKSDDGLGAVTTYFFLDGSSVTTQFYKTIKLYDDAQIYIGDDNDLRFYHNGTSNIDNYTGNLDIIQRHNDGDIRFYNDDGSGGTTEYFRVDGGEGRIVYSQNGRHLDNVVSMYGSGADLQIKHDGSNSYISNNTGTLYVQQLADDSDIVFQSDDGSGGVAEYFRVDGGATKTIASKAFQFFDNVKAEFGDSSDLHIRHDGTNSIVENSTGDLRFTNKADDKDIIFQSDDGSGGVAEYFSLDGSIARVKFSKNLHILDNVRAEFGGNNDLQIYHDGTDSYIHDNGTGDLRVRTNRFVLNNAADTENLIRAEQNSTVELFFNGQKKLETTNTGVSITGDLTVSGTTTTVNQTNLDVSDNIIGLNRGASTNTNDSGLIIERGTTGDNAAFLWDESEDKFVFGLTTATPSATGNVSLSDFRGIKTGPITASGSITASSDITTTGSYFADTHFRSTDGNATLSATGGGGVYLRPNGFSSTTGQVLIDASNGDATFSGGLSVNTSGSIYGTDNQAASIYMTGSGKGLSGKFGSYVRNLIRSNGTNTIQIGDNTSLISLIQLKAGSSSVDGVIQLMTHNTERMRVTHDGRVGVNTSSPGAKLHVVESTTNTQALRVDDGTSFVSVVPSLGSGGYTGVSSAGDIGLIFSIDGDNTTDTTNGLLIAPHTQTSGGLKILENGNVGIGVATPNTKLQVAGIIQSTESGNSAFYGGDYVRVFNNQNFRFRNSGGTVIANIGMSGNSYFNGGNVGIGTTSPAQKLHVMGTTRISGTNNLDIYSDNTAGTFNIASSTRGFLFKNSNGNLLTINSGGQVGVGTSSPQTNTKLEVSGALKAGNKTSWSDRDGAALTTTGRVVAGLTGNANGNGASALYIFTCYGGNGYQRIVYSCRNQSGTWVVNKDIDEGVDAFDVVASTPSSGSAVTFTFKGRTSNQSYTASVFIEHMGHNLDTQYVG